MKVVLIEPQIPPNTGNIARLCAATSIPLYLVGRLGFEITDRHLKRAGLDYWEYVVCIRKENVEEFLDSIPDDRLHFFSKKAPRCYTEASYRAGDYLVFGSETGGLPHWIHERYAERCLRIPMVEKGVRSLNLSSAVAIGVYEAIRQTGWSGGAAGEP